MFYEAAESGRVFWVSGDGSPEDWLRPANGALHLAYSDHLTWEVCLWIFFGGSSL